MGLLRPTADPEVHRVSSTAARAARASSPLRCHTLQSFPHPHSRTRVTARRFPLAVATCVPTCGGDATSGPCSMRVSVARGRRCQRLGPVALLGFPSLEPHDRCLSCPPRAAGPSPGDDRLDVRPARVRRALEGPARPRAGLDPVAARPALPRGAGRSPSAGPRRTTAPPPYPTPHGPCWGPETSQTSPQGPKGRRGLRATARRFREPPRTSCHGRAHHVVHRVSGGLPRGEPATRRVGPEARRHRAARTVRPDVRLPPTPVAGAAAMPPGDPPAQRQARPRALRWSGHRRPRCSSGPFTGRRHRHPGVVSHAVVGRSSDDEAVVVYAIPHLSARCRAVDRGAPPGARSGCHHPLGCPVRPRRRPAVSQVGPMGTAPRAMARDRRRRCPRRRFAPASCAPPLHRARRAAPGRPCRPTALTPPPRWPCPPQRPAARRRDGRSPRDSGPVAALQLGPKARLGDDPEAVRPTPEGAADPSTDRQPEGRWPPGGRLTADP